MEQDDRARGQIIRSRQYDVRVAQWSDLVDERLHGLNFIRGQLDYDVSQMARCRACASGTERSSQAGTRSRMTSHSGVSLGLIRSAHRWRHLTAREVFEFVGYATCSVVRPGPTTRLRGGRGGCRLRKRVNNHLNDALRSLLRIARNEADVGLRGEEHQGEECPRQDSATAAREQVAVVQRPAEGAISK